MECYGSYGMWEMVNDEIVDVLRCLESSGFQRKLHHKTRSLCNHFYSFTIHPQQCNSYTILISTSNLKAKPLKYSIPKKLFHSYKNNNHLMMMLNVNKTFVPEPTTHRDLFEIIPSTFENNLFPSRIALDLF